MEAEKIFDALQHTGIYIVDRETMITYYENPIAQQYSVKRANWETLLFQSRKYLHV